MKGFYLFRQNTVTMNNLSYTKNATTSNANPNILSEENLAEWIAMYWGMSKRFRNKLDGELKRIK